MNYASRIAYETNGPTGPASNTGAPVPQRERRRSRRTSRRGRLGVILVMMLAMLTVATMPLAADDGDVTIEGTVLSAPGTADGLGRYVVNDGAQTYAVDADADTDFDGAWPQTGERARVEGELRQDGTVLATRIRVLSGNAEPTDAAPDDDAADDDATDDDVTDDTPEPDETETPEPDESETPEPDESETPTATPVPGDDDDDDNGSDDDGSDDDGSDDDGDDDDVYEDPCLDLDEDRWDGIVITRPEPAPVGSWAVQIDSETQLTVVVDALTTLDYGIPAVGEWIEVRGRLRDAQSCIVDAERMRPDDFRGGEIVVRLTATDIVSQTVASDYGMLAKSTLLRSGSIYLFTIVDDDVLDEDDDEQRIIDRMQADPRVEWAEFNFINSVPEGEGYKTWGWGGVDPTDYQNQEALEQVKLDVAQTAYGGAGIIVAVLDTGADLGHPAFGGRLLAGRDVVDDDDRPHDEGYGLAWGHGTHVTGVVAVSAPEAMILPVRVLDSNGRGNMFTLAYAIEWAVAQGADVINLSIGAESESRVLGDAIADAVSQGVVVVAAAGNLNSSTIQYPAGYPDVLSVAAVDGDNYKAAFSSFGHGWVDIAAPGVGITSTIIGPQGSGYANWSGTSMAAPFVSGAAAMTLEAVPTASPASVTAMLLDGAVDIDALNPTHAGQLGRLLDVAAALNVQAPVNPGAEPRRIFLPTITLQ